MTALDRFITAVGGATNAANVLGVSGTIIQRWRSVGPSRKHARRIDLWLHFDTEHERFILRNVWAHEDRLWLASAEEFTTWLRREFKVLNDRVGFDRAVKLWNEVYE